MRLLLFLIGLSALGLSGCGPKRFRSDFANYERSVAETSNHELLLNLARLENHDPTYFFKTGQIVSNYTMSASLTGAGNYAASTSNPTIGGPAGGGTPLATYSNTPIFNFIPVDDATNAQLLLKPVPAETFYFLYEQGWRADQLVRLMVDRIELTRYSAEKHTCTVEMFHNAPPTAYLNPDGTPDKGYLRDPAALTSYVTFLRINAVVYWLQKHGYLLLRGTNTFVPYSLDNQSGLDDSTTAATNAPKGADFVTAAQKNAVWQHDAKSNKWILGEKVFIPVFSLYPLASDGVKLGPDINAIETEILADPDMAELKHGPALRNVLQALAAGFTIEGSTNQQDACTSTAGTSGVSAHLVMRSLIGLMAAAAQEQAPYDKLADANPVIPLSTYLTDQQKEQLNNPPKLLDAVPAVERIPLLRLTGAAAGEETIPVIELNYRGQNYRIVDAKSAAGTVNEYWNRDVFRLINQLTSQVTVDISKFPLTEILQ
jgi:hypothetical protein